MDRLIKYFDFRIKTYGGITPSSAASTMYYQMGPVMVRVSDHMVYGESAKFCNYNFIIQENGQYIFITNPKNNPQEKMYMKIVDYPEAKEFIRTLHEWSLNFNKLSNFFVPDNWNREIPKEEPVKEKITWGEFFTRFLSNKDNTKQQSFCDKVDMILYGKVQKGTLDLKLNKMQNMWDEFSATQYGSIINKAMEANK